LIKSFMVTTSREFLDVKLLVHPILN
jgi:hypothetical protein